MVQSTAIQIDPSAVAICVWIAGWLVANRVGHPQRGDVVDAALHGLCIDVRFVVISRQVPVFFECKQGCTITAHRILSRAVPIGLLTAGQNLVLIEIQQALFDRHVHPLLMSGSQQHPQRGGL